MHVLCFGIDVTATKLYRKLLFLKKKTVVNTSPFLKLLAELVEIMQKVLIKICKPKFRHF